MRHSTIANTDTLHRTTHANADIAPSGTSAGLLPIGCAGIAIGGRANGVERAQPMIPDALVFAAAFNAHLPPVATPSVLWCAMWGTR